MHHHFSREIEMKQLSENLTMTVPWASNAGSTLRIPSHIPTYSRETHIHTHTVTHSRAARNLMHITCTQEKEKERESSRRGMSRIFYVLGAQQKHGTLGAVVIVCF